MTTLPTPPSNAEKHSYITRYRGYLLFAVTIGNASILATQVLMEAAYHVYALIPWTVFTVVHLGLSVAGNFGGRDFDLAAHNEMVRSWRPRRYPDVDIYLPVCGEPLTVLANTWKHVRALLRAYPGRAVAYVLDDGDSADAAALAAGMGLRYVVREDRGWMKKAGNLRHAFTHTAGEFFVIIDADFTPRPDFLAETLPYFDDPAVAIVQTPQFFPVTPQLNWVERGAGALQEVFYRCMQVSRDTFGGAQCCGSCAVYRRAAVAEAGGPALIAYAEDVHTGLDAVERGWKLRYVPVNLASGASASNVDAFVHQQYRWCLGSTTPLRRLWRVPMSARARIAYLSGFSYYLITSLVVFVVPPIAIGTLAFVPQVVQLEGYVLFVPAVISTVVLYPVWHGTEFGPGTWALELARSWAHALAIWDYFRGRVMAWQPTGGSVPRVRRMWVGVVAWSGGSSAVWFALSIWRCWDLGLARFAAIALFALFYLIQVVWLLADRAGLRAPASRPVGRHALVTRRPRWEEAG